MYALSENIHIQKFLFLYTELVGMAIERHFFSSTNLHKSFLGKTWNALATPDSHLDANAATVQIHMQSHIPDRALCWFPDEDQIIFSRMNWDSELPVISSLVYTSTVTKNHLKNISNYLTDK